MERVSLKVAESSEWLEGLKDSTNEFLRELREFDNIASDTGKSAVEKFKRVYDIKVKYKLSRVPEGLLYSIFIPEVEKMAGVKLEENEDSVVFSVDSLTLEFKLGFNDKVYVQDHSEFKHSTLRSSHIPKFFHEILGEFEKYQDGKISKFRLRNEIARLYVEERKEKGRRVNRVMRELLATYDVYFSKSRIHLFAEEMMKKKEWNRKAEEEQKECDRLNEERRDKRKRVLNESGLGRLIEEVRIAGLKVDQSGIVHEKF